jgi:hypothetical protein
LAGRATAAPHGPQQHAGGCSFRQNSALRVPWACSSIQVTHSPVPWACSSIQVTHSPQAHQASNVRAE